MPADRFIHPKLGHSKKVTALTDLEYRVWTQYLLSADDFGVMRCSSIALQADNDALHAKPPRVIQRCLERLIEVGLVAEFDRQGQRFICQLDWHRWQHFNLPRMTNNPAPPTAVLNRCEDGTATLFYSHHPELVNGAPTDDVDAPPDAPQHTTNTNDTRLTLTTNGVREGFAEFWKAYPRRVGKDAAWKAWQKRKPDAALMDKIRQALDWQRVQDNWLRDGGRFIPHPATWLNQARWEDEPPTTPHLSGSSIQTFRAGQEFLNDGRR